jgi:RNA polymerase sigma factor FliA
MSNVVRLQPRLTPKQQALVAFAMEKRLVEMRAAYVVSRYKGLLDKDEAEALGAIGLTEAARSFREELSSFEDYARRRIDGAILDGVRAEAPHARASRAVRKAVAVLLEGYRDDFNPLVHDKDELKRRLAKMTDAVLSAAFLGVAEEAKRGTGGEDDLALRREYAHALRSLPLAMMKLAPRQQRILALVYHEGRDMNELPGVLGVSYNTVRRDHHRALGVLREQLLALDVPRAPPPLDDVQEEEAERGRAPPRK